LEKVIPRGEERFSFPSLIFNNLIAGDKKNEHGETVDSYGLEDFSRQISQVNCIIEIHNYRNP